MRRSLFALAALGLAAALLAVAPAGAEPSTDGPVPPAGEESSPDPSPAPPGEEAALVGAVSVATGYYHSCARLANNEVRCWGYNEYGQLGDGFPGIDSYTAVVTKNANGDGPLQNVTQVVAGDLFTCALLTTRQVHCWGYNEYGQLGDGTFDDSSLPVVVQNVAGDGPLQNVRQIGAEGGGMCAVLTNDELRCWGEDDLGQLGNGAPLTNSNLPVIVKGLGGNGRLTGVASVGGGYGNNCAVLRNGQARCWGYNGGGLTYSVLGNGNSTDTPHPVVVKNLAGTGPLTGVTQISNGGYHGCARLSNGQARCWGENYEGALGTGNLTERLLPVAVRRVGGGALTGVVRILAGVDSTCRVGHRGPGPLLGFGRIRPERRRDLRVAALPHAAHPGAQREQHGEPAERDPLGPAVAPRLRPALERPGPLLGLQQQRRPGQRRHRRRAPAGGRPHLAPAPLGRPGPAAVHRLIVTPSPAAWSGCRR